MGFDVICTNPSNKSSVKFCVGEVFEDRGGISMGRIGEASVQAWGCPRRHPIFLKGNVACNFKKIPTIMQDLSRRCIATRGGQCVHVPS